MKNPEFREVPCYTVHPFAKKMADQYEHHAAMGSPSSFLSNEQFAGAVTMAAHTLAELLIRMMRRTSFNDSWAALVALGAMISDLLKAELIKSKQPDLLRKRT